MFKPNRIHSNHRRALRAAGWIVACALGATTSSFASSFDPITLEQRVVRADLIVDATVVSVSHRSAIPITPEQRALPHTFVTFEIHALIKGSIVAEKLTLRMLGGPDGAGGEVELVGTPKFQPGDRDILFVRGNGDELCPIIGWESGRMRIVNDEIYSHDGRDLWITPKGRLALGERTIDVDHFPYSRRTDLDETDPSHAEPPSFSPPAGSIRPDANGFANALAEMCAIQFVNGAMSLPKVTISLDPGASFSVPPLDVSPPPVTTPTPEGPLFQGEYDAREADLIRKQRAARD